MTRGATAHPQEDSPAGYFSGYRREAVESAFPLLTQPVQKSWTGRSCLKSVRHFRRVARAEPANRFPQVPEHGCRRVLRPSHCVLFVLAICRKVPKVRNAGDEAFALAIEDCPVPDPGHASPSLFQPKAARGPPREEQRIPAKNCIPSSRRRSQNLTHWSFFQGLGVP